jgi:hypothetical protein
MRKLLASVAVAAALAFSQPASACCGVVGADGNTRAIWHGTDGSISIWLLNPAMNVLATQNYGPIDGWEESGSAMIGNNLYILWRNLDGQADIWLLNSSLGFVTSAVFGPVAGWEPEGLNVDGQGNLRLFWRTSENQMTCWVINQALDYVGSDPVYGPYFGWVF